MYDIFIGSAHQPQWGVHSGCKKIDTLVHSVVFVKDINLGLSSVNSMAEMFGELSQIMFAVFDHVRP